MVRKSRVVPELKLARHELEQWGRWWRWREISECSQAGTSLSAILMEICILGVRVQTTNTQAHMHLSSHIRCPGSIEDMDERVEQLPIQQRNALVMRYIRRDRSWNGKLALLKAELAIGEMIARDHIDEWATA